MNTYIKEARGIFWFLLFLTVALFSTFYFAHSGEKWRDNMGITIDAASREADYIRRNQNRATRDINAVNRTQKDGWRSR